MDVGINNVIYMELHLGPKMANGTRVKTIVAGMIDRDSTVLQTMFFSAKSTAKYYSVTSMSGLPSALSILTKVLLVMHCFLL
jgi:hypothetical protein